MARTPTPPAGCILRIRSRRWSRSWSVLWLPILLLLFTACRKPSERVEPITGPAKPTAVTLTRGDGRLIVSWTSDALEHNLYLATEPGVDLGNYTTLAGGRKIEGVSSPYTIAGLVNGTTYYLVVTAVAGSSESEPSAEVSGTPSAGPPVAPPPSGTIFDPDSDVTLPGGQFEFAGLTIRPGVTVRVADDTVITVSGNATIDGALRGDCYRIELRVAGDLTLDGLVANPCPDPAAGGDLKLLADGELIIGSTPANEEAILSDGMVAIVDSVTEFDPLEPVMTAEGLGGDGVAAPHTTTAQPALAPQGRGRARLNRPIRARHGMNVRRNGDLDIGPIGALTAGDGADALAPGALDVANCDRSRFIGGAGGSIYLASRNGTLTINGVLTAGNGGAGADCFDTKGHPGAASAKAGHGGRGGGVYVGGVSIRFGAGAVVVRGTGGAGGDAIAKGRDGQNPCEDGNAATAVGGTGGKAGSIGYLYFSPPPNIVGAPVEKGGNGGRGGLAKAEGGDANPNCNVGDGGDGGNASATGGKGGDGVRLHIWPVAGGHVSGDGGDAIALGGHGGGGLDNCAARRPGGAGGKGGNGDAVGGQPGRRGSSGVGQIGKANAVGGLGGDGGDGLPPGDGGGKGTATAAGRMPTQTDGRDGKRGNPCPVLGFFLMAPELPDGLLTPGLYELLVVDSEGFPTGDIVGVEVRDDGAEYRVENGRLIIAQGGGLEFDLRGVTGIVSAFQVITDAGCNEPGTVRLRGLIDNEVVVNRTFELAAGQNILQIDLPDGIEEIYLEAEGAPICLGAWSLQLAITPIVADVRYLDLRELPSGVIEPGSIFDLGTLHADGVTPAAITVPTVFQDALDASYVAEVGNVFVAYGGLELHLRDVAAQGGIVDSVTVLIDPLNCDAFGATVTLTGLVDNTTVAFDQAILGEEVVALQIEAPDGLEDVYLETPDGAFCIAAGDVFFTVLR